ncbi:hypothetical protein HCU73_10005 [Roseibacterium sp. KMU-115]|uniref:Peptidase inhibitor I78 family protein n=2 Tax=Roseicyclus persicicus TaxID=2650661 RepID=A0A7X6JZL2_9RHOB|nr:hypothetical protein [Roseibacterium persicicum]
MALANGGGTGMREPQPPIDGPDTCGAAAFVELVGQPAAALEGLSFDGPVRVIGPRQAVTMDFLPQRINFLVDDAGVITRIRCG